MWPFIHAVHISLSAEVLQQCDSALATGISFWTRVALVSNKQDPGSELCRGAALGVVEQHDCKKQTLAHVPCS